MLSPVLLTSADSNKFWKRVVVKGVSDCWEWQGSIDTRGYGSVRVLGKMYRTHRYAYMLSYGDIPRGEGHHGTVVMHKCDNRLCCNPHHLQLGSHADNMRDMKEKHRRKNIGIGEGNGRAILTREQVEAIRLDERGTRTIAKHYPVSRAAIQRIKSGKAWASVK